MIKRGPKTNNVEKKRMGRPKKEFRWDLFDKLCAFPMTCEDISSLMDIHISTISRTVMKETGITFEEYKYKKQSKLRMTLLQKQIEVATAGSIPMLIFLGKNYLNQHDGRQVLDKTFEDAARLVINMDEKKVKNLSKKMAAKKTVKNAS